MAAMSSKKSKRDADELPPREVVTVVDETVPPDNVPCSDLGWARGESDKTPVRTAQDWQESLRCGLFEPDYPTPQDFANDPSRGDRMRLSNPRNYVPFTEDDL
jgi:hypothetical protein